MSDATPPAPEPAPGKRDAKAQAAAAKAYAKANRNWFARHKILTGLGALVVVGIIASAVGGGGGSGDKNDASSATTSNAGTAASKKPASNSGQNTSGSSDAYGSAKMPLQNGDWRLDSIQVKDDGLGDMGGTARVTYTGDDPDGGDNIFTITVFKGKNVVATLNGSANTVKPGTTVTVQLISQDKMVGGPYKFDFQNDL